MTLAHELISDIKEHGPLTVADYMARANAHYYATRDPFGAKGDFTTAPEISQIFGELAGAWMADAWDKLGAKRSVLCEMGPGRGTLMKDMLRATRSVAGFFEAIDIRLIETSPHLHKLQQEMLATAHPRITWHEALDDLPPLPLFLIANEFFDALPVEQFVKVGIKEVLRRVGYDGAGLKWEPQGKVIRETSPASLGVMAQIATHIRKYGGAALVIDYGYEGGGGGDTLQAVRRHGYADPLQAPGEVDLTNHVDFGALAREAAKSGSIVSGSVEQGDFLRRLGAELRATALCKAAKPQQRNAILSGLERIMAPHQMGGLFKVLAVTWPLEAPAGF